MNNVESLAKASKELMLKEPFKIYQNTVIRFNFMDRIKVLFRKKVFIWDTIEVSKEVDVLKGYTTVSISPIFKNKSKGYSECKGSA